MKHDAGSGGGSQRKACRAWLGDLVRAAGVTDAACSIEGTDATTADGLEPVSSLLGLDRRPQDSVKHKMHAGGSESVEDKRPFLPIAGTQQPSTPFLRPTKLSGVGQASAGPGPAAAAVSAADLVREFERLPKDRPVGPPLVPWRSLEPRLREALLPHHHSRRLDTARAVERAAQLRESAPIPWKLTVGYGTRVTLVLDRSRELTPIFTDQDWLQRRVERWLGGRAIRVRRVDGPAICWGPAGTSESRLRVPPGDSLLLVSHGGLGPSDGCDAAWSELVRRVNIAGGRSVLLSATAGSWWTPQAEFHRVGWTSSLDGERNRTATEAAATRLLLPFAGMPRVFPSQLREVRRRFYRDLDVSTEIAAWRHRDVEKGTPGILWFSGAATARWEERLRAAWQDDEVLREARAFVVSMQDLPEDLHLAAGLSEERLGTFLPGVEERILRAREFVARLEASHLHIVNHGVLQESLQLWFADPGNLGAVAHTSNGALHQDLRRVLQKLCGLAPTGDPGSWSLWIHGDRLTAQPIPAAPEYGTSLLAELPGEPLTIQGSREVPRSDSGRQWWVDGASSLHVVTNRASLTCESAYRPPWATAMGRDRAGLWLQVGERSEPVFFRWEAEPVRDEASDVAYRWRWDAERAPGWISEAGVDEFGAWAAVRVKEMPYRFRWIPSGAFTMGSPEGEAGWFDNEPQREVVIAMGFWLGETPVTQGFWEAVTGKTPSFFGGDDNRPVEQVSYEDCVAMVAEASLIIEGLAVRLPKEAEWEYACRAGTRTATYAGNLTIEGDNNAPELDGIAWYGGNSGVDWDRKDGIDSSEWPEKAHSHTRAGTRPVRGKKPNDWGLYDMLGNVYEWCDDLLREGVAFRVVRGGAWYSSARSVRAALRDGYASDPGHRVHDVGVRLSRGHGLGAHGLVEPAERAPREPRRRRSRRRDA